MLTQSFVSHREEVVKSLKDAAAQRMLASVITVKNETTEMLSGQRHGRRYKVPTTGRGRVGEGRSIAGTGVWYTASAPGEAPANRLGGLRGSIDYKVHGEGQSLVGDVGTKLKYGAPLEFGTLRMSARPWLRKSFEKAMDAILGIWGKPWL
jgi:hypothetical protein